MYNGSDCFLLVILCDLDYWARFKRKINPLHNWGSNAIKVGYVLSLFPLIAQATQRDFYHYEGLKVSEDIWRFWGMRMWVGVGI